jgi:hypothetical protein
MQAYFNGSYGEEIVKEHFSLIYEVFLPALSWRIPMH